VNWLRILLSFAPKFRAGQADNLADTQAISALTRAQDLLTAIDRGGIPLSPIIVNRIARNLGLEVATTDLMPDTIERIRHYIDAQGLTP
jgi:hypothetical protein